MQGPGFDSWVGKTPWRRKWQPTLVFLPGEFHGQRSMVGYSSWYDEKLSNILGKRLEENNGPTKIYDREKKFK